MGTIRSIWLTPAIIPAITIIPGTMARGVGIPGGGVGVLGRESPLDWQALVGGSASAMAGGILLITVPMVPTVIGVARWDGDLGDGDWGRRSIRPATTSMKTLTILP